MQGLVVVRKTPGPARARGGGGGQKTCIRGANFRTREGDGQVTGEGRRREYGGRQEEAVSRRRGHVLAPARGGLLAGDQVLGLRRSDEVLLLAWAQLADLTERHVHDREAGTQAQSQAPRLAAGHGPHGVAVGNGPAGGGVGQATQIRGQAATGHQLLAAEQPLHGHRREIGGLWPQGRRGAEHDPVIVCGRLRVDAVVLPPAPDADGHVARVVHQPLPRQSCGLLLQRHRP
mmetsp:Transcript_848/g.2320  ORF Transcript_848/g.2320 Transcript_848/m.2320 type:complete len:232 (-) Transcript_848:1250-1945(-)